jgi:(p)ppGpp synthase/HD superfamily hydrolase
VAFGKQTKEGDMMGLLGGKELPADAGENLAVLFVRALERACEVHLDQVDKAGAPYLLHPLRMMLRMDTIEEKMVALLHDVVEDSPKESPVTLEDLRRDGFSEAVVTAVDCLTKREENKNRTDHYDLYLEKIKGNELAREVKLADLEDNLKLDRLKEITPSDIERLNKYKRAHKYLNEKSDEKRDPSPNPGGLYEISRS